MPVLTYLMLLFSDLDAFRGCFHVFEFRRWGVFVLIWNLLYGRLYLFVSDGFLFSTMLSSFR